jgi:hypothetical protein
MMPKPAAIAPTPSAPAIAARARRPARQPAPRPAARRSSAPYPPRPAARALPPAKKAASTRTTGAPGSARHRRPEPLHP